MPLIKNPDNQIQCVTDEGLGNSGKEGFGLFGRGVRRSEGAMDDGDFSLVANLCKPYLLSSRLQRESIAFLPIGRSRDAHTPSRLLPDVAAKTEIANHVGWPGYVALSGSRKLERRNPKKGKGMNRTEPTDGSNVSYVSYLPAGTRAPSINVMM